MSTFRTTLAHVALALAVLLTPAIARAAPGPAPSSLPVVSTNARPAVPADTLDALAQAEDESLASHRAGKWSTGEIVVTVLLLIFLFPIGLIVLIILLIVNKD